MVQEGNRGNGGSIVGYFDTNSADNILQTAFPLFLYYGVKNKTFELNIEYSLFGLFELNLENVHVNNAFTRKSRHFGYSQDLNKTEEKFEIDDYDLDGETLRFKITSMSFDIDIKGKISILGWTFEFNHLDINDVGVEFLFNKEDLDGSKWKLGQLNRVTYDQHAIQLAW